MKTYTIALPGAGPERGLLEVKAEDTLGAIRELLADESGATDGHEVLEVW